MNTANYPCLLQHPSHEHALVLQELSESFIFECKICRLSVKGGLSYHCMDCKFFIHKSCADLPPEIQHPSHPQHPLAIIGYSSEPELCKGCVIFIHLDEYRYKCRLGCGVDLHVGCAAATLPPPEEEHKDQQEHEDKDKDCHEDEMIQHFTHEHPLASFHVNVPNRIRCRACGDEISSCVYGCRACIFVLHKSCGLAPREIINHPFHPQHPLTLLAHLKNRFGCKACGSYGHFAYNCNDCGLILDVKCAVSIMHPPPRDDQSSTDDRREIHHFSHPHQLTSFHAKVELHATCDVCKKKITGDFYCCADCLFWLHVSCAEFPQEIVHPLHPDHPLFFQAGRLYCSLCSSNYKSKSGYKCEECLFGLHVGCALRSLSATEEELALNSELFHEHPMRLRCQPEGYKCIVCKWPGEGLGYYCPVACCHAWIHKTCAELPRESEQPIHPQHPLLLLSEPPDKSSPCFACLESSWGFTFYCDYCKIQFHAHCAMRRPTLKHQRHEHSLSYFGKIGHKPYSVQCNVCYDDCRIDFYRCVRCNYNLHFSCMPLPPYVKHTFHHNYHPLVLRDRFVDDKLDYEEQYCDACETLRHPEHGVYYCEECNYAADIDCVIPKVNPTSQNSTTFSKALSSRHDSF
ncbi:hypothetical protein CDL15_Pgr000441 [Punica granatum]|uniref:Phorbol-ester/DAG-type domain-containing protein n=1 Tax=Punica granatum TaxID=22663 RepID=A0A218W381_PUNGR|nr:hypothetical protein CDL15_Pgr000441 [Punica granatum]